MYFAADLFGNGFQVTLCALYDGVQPFTHNRYAYLPASWLADEFPEHSVVVLAGAEAIKERCRQEEAQSATSA